MVFLPGVAHVLDTAEVLAEREEERAVVRPARDGSVDSDVKPDARLFAKVDGRATAPADPDHFHVFRLGAERLRVGEVSREEGIQYLSLTFRERSAVHAPSFLLRPGRMLGHRRAAIGTTR